MRQKHSFGSGDVAPNIPASTPPRRRRGGVLAGMFGETSPLPRECFWRICEYWRGIRDYGSAWPENVGSPSGPDIPGRREIRENMERLEERYNRRRETRS